MNINCSLEHEDYLQLQLYLSSINPIHNQKRKRSRWLVTLLYMGLGFWMYSKHEQIIAVLPFLAIALVWFFIYPLYAKWRYKRHFSKHIESHFDERIGKEVEYSFQESKINIQESGIESNIEHSQIDSVHEMSKSYYVALASKIYLILPKRSVSDEIEFKNYFKNHNIEVLDQNAWQW